MTNSMDKILQGLAVSEVIKPTGQPTQLDDEAIKRYFDARNTPFVFHNPSSSSITRNAKLKNTTDETKPNEPIS